MKKVRKNIWYAGNINHDAPLKGTDKDSILTYIYDTKIVPWYTTYLLQKRISNVEVQEYMQEIWLQICKLQEERLIDLIEQGKTALTSYIAVLIKQNCKSANSPAYWHIRRENKRYVHIQSSEWDQYDEEGDFPNYLKYGALRSIEEYDSGHIIANISNNNDYGIED